MANLRKFGLSKDNKKNDWVLKEEGANRATKRFDTKAEATTAGVLSDALGGKGGSVRIRKEDGTIQEERTFPRASDPTKTPG